MSLVERCRTLQAVGVPSFFYGTAWKEERTERLTALALDAGFRAIDTANQRRHYVEAAVGRAIGTALATGTVTRAELFLQTKFTHVRGHDHRIPYDKSRNISEQVLESFKSSLEHLGTTYVDSYLIHGPSAPDRLTEADWEELKKAVLARARADLQADVEAGVWIVPAYDLGDVFRRAEELSAVYTPKLGTRSLDILHVAAALELSVRTFVTGDARQAKLASACRLQVVQLGE